MKACPMWYFVKTQNTQTKHTKKKLLDLKNSFFLIISGDVISIEFALCISAVVYWCYLVGCYSCLFLHISNFCLFMKGEHFLCENFECDAVRQKKRSFFFFSLFYVWPILCVWSNWKTNNWFNILFLQVIHATT